MIHTKRSPSQAKRFLTCPGVFAMCDSLSDHHQGRASGIAAQTGTAVHGLVERCLREGSNPEDFRGRIVELVGDEEDVSILRANAKVPGAGRTFFEVDSDMIDGAEMMTTYVRERCKALGVSEKSIQLETRTNPLPERDDTSGTADVTIDAWPELLEVIDYKNGYNVVEHEDNEQILAYLLGKALESDFAHEHYRVTVCQPNAGHEDGRIRSFNTTKEDLLAFQKRYREGIALCEKAEEAFQTFQPDTTRGNVGLWTQKYLAAGDHCMFCPAQAVCPARVALAQDQAKMDFAEEPRELTFPERGADVARILAWAPQMDSLIKAANLYAKCELEAGGKVPGYKLVRGRSTRRWGDMPEKVIASGIVKYGFVKDEKLLYQPAKLISGPQAEKLVEKDRRKQFEELFLHKPEGALTVTRESDPRPAVTCSAADDFAEEDFG